MYFTIFCLTFRLADSQTLIGTSYSKSATAGHNQRKITRISTGEIYIVYQDSSTAGYFLKFAAFDSIANTWSQPVSLFPGSSPTMAVTADDQIYICYVAPDSSICFVKIIMGGWTNPVTVSRPNTTNRLPVSDVSQSGLLHIIWIETDSTGLESVVYANSAPTLYRKIIFTDEDHVGINDVAIANSLFYLDNCVYFVYSLQNGYNSDFLKTCNNGTLIDTISSVYQETDTVTGSFPCLTVTNVLGHDIAQTHVWIDYESTCIARAYLDTEKNIMSNCLWGTYGSLGYIYLDNPVEYLCIDDEIQFLGYSFLFLQNSVLYHAFSYGDYGSQILDTLSAAAFYPTIAYKQFNILNTDVAWMEYNGTNYDILYRRLDKIQQITAIPDLSQNISITSFPNPASDQVSFHIITKENSDCGLTIYNLKGLVINEFKDDLTSNDHSFNWDLKNPEGSRVAAGYYLLKVKCGNKMTCRKMVIY